MPQIKRIPSNPSMNGLSRMHPDVVFSQVDGLALKCTIFTPWNEAPDATYPAIVFLQGSAWKFPDRNYELPQLAWYANHGYVVMSITHRSSLEGHPYPAFLQDAKTAIRYLRAHAEQYHVDPDRIGFWGTSSGGNTSMLVQLTGDDPTLKTDEYADQSDAVKCCVECFGPSDMTLVVQAHQATGRHNGKDDLFTALVGEQDADDVICGMSPYCRIRDGETYPPMLMLHGDADELVEYKTQGVRMYERYLQAGVDAQLICIEGAPHEGPFWSWQVHDEILRYWQQKL